MTPASVERLRPLAPRDWPEGFAAAAGSALRPPDDARHPVPPRAGASPKGLHALGLQAHHPELAAAFNQSIRHALYYSTLDPRWRELLVLRVAHLRRSDYEWAQHVFQAGAVGITDDDIQRIRVGPDDEAWPVFEAALLAAADELIGGARLSDATYATLARELSRQQLMDVVFTVGFYETFAMALRTFDVELDEDLGGYR